MTDMVVARKEGLYCVPGKFFIDPWKPVEHAVITHAHADHARPGNGNYIAAAVGSMVLRARLGEISLTSLEYGDTRVINGVKVSLHPAGHVLGSAQVRMEQGGEIWVASGDYKLESDGTCAAFESVKCDTFITESTFGMPIYRWRPQAEIFSEINAWWRSNAAERRTSILYCYAFGKAQRILAGVDASIAPIICHGAVNPLIRAYRAAGVNLPTTYNALDAATEVDLNRSLVLAPPSAARSPWVKRFGNFSDGFASGWMQLRGARRRRSVDRGFVLSDHADWPGLLQAIQSTGAKRVIVTHGHIPVMVRWLRDRGLEAGGFATEYGMQNAQTLAGDVESGNA